MLKENIPRDCECSWSRSSASCRWLVGEPVLVLEDGCESADEEKIVLG